MSRTVCAECGAIYMSACHCELDSLRAALAAAENRAEEAERENKALRNERAALVYLAEQRGAAYDIEQGLRIAAEAERDRLRERLDQFEAAGFPNVATVLDRVTAAEVRLSRAVEALREAEAHHDEQARLWDDNESDGEADLNAQYHAERRDVFRAVLAEVGE